MTHVRLTRELLAEGYTHEELAQLTRVGALTRVRRGAYHASIEDDPALRHLRLVEATVRLTARNAVVSHNSAAVVHGLPVVSTSLSRVQVTRPDSAGGRNRGGVHLYAAPLHPDEVVLVRGMAVTSLARTVVDLGRTESFERAVMAGDAALRRGAGSDDLESSLLRASRRPGVAKARRAVGFLDLRSESPGESLSRIALHELKIPPPTLQYEVRDQSGRLVGRADFCWEEQRTLGEFDGRVKYGRLLKPGETAGDVIYAEKLREDEFRDLGWQVVRWTYPELTAPRPIAARLQRAFARADRQR